MKQRTQIISESLHEVADIVLQLREVACDLRDCDVQVDQLVRATDQLRRFRLAVQGDEARDRLVKPLPPLAGRADPKVAALISSALDSFEDPPCIACGAPESVCECDDADLRRFASFENSAVNP